MIAQDATESARRLGILVLEVDGSLDADAVAEVVANYFAPFLD